MLTTSRTPRSRSPRLLAVITVASLVLAACGNSGDDDSADDSAPETTEPVTTELQTTEPVTTEPETTEPETTDADDAQPDLGEFQPIEGVPGVTDQQISFAVLGTGPSNPLGYCLLECYLGGVKAYFDYRNSLGGVHGRELVVGRVDDDELANTQVKALELIGDDSIFGIFGAPLQYTGYSDIGESGVPLYTTWPASPAANGYENIYVPSGTLCIDCPRRLVVQSAALAGATKAASIGFGISQPSKDCVNNNEATFQRWGPDTGVEFVYKNDTLPFGFPNGLGPEVTAMKEAGVDFIVTCIDQNSALTLEQELHRQGMEDVTVVLPQGYGDTEFISGNADLLEGDMLGLAFRPLEADPGDTMIPTMTEWMEAGGYQITDFTVQGWVGAELAVTGLLAAGPQFDRASVVEATNRITDWTSGGVLPPVDWSRQHTAPTAEDPVTNGPPFECQAFVFVRGGAVENAGDPAKPFFCFDPAVEGWEEPTPMSFE